METFFPPNFLSRHFSPMTDSLINNNNNIVPENCMLLSFVPAYHRPLFRKSSRPRRLFVSSKLRTLRSSVMRDALYATLKIATLYNHPSIADGYSQAVFLLLSPPPPCPSIDLAYCISAQKCNIM